MAGQPAGNQEQRVDTRIVAIAQEARREPLGRDRDAPQPIVVERDGGGIASRALLDLDKRHNAPAPRDKVDFAARDTRAPRQDPPAVEPQPPSGDGLRTAAALLGLAAAQREFARSSARA